MTIDELFAECQERRDGLTLRHARWYAATLRNGTVVILRARKCLPTWESYWILIPERDDRPYEYDGGTWLLLRGDGGLDHDGSMEPDDADPGDRVHAEGLTLDDLVTADDRARAAWRALHGDAAPCSRCGARARAPPPPAVPHRRRRPAVPDLRRGGLARARGGRPRRVGGRRGVRAGGLGALASLSGSAHVPDDDRSGQAPPPPWGGAIGEITAMDERVDILTDDEVDTLILALLEGQGKAGATDEEMEDAVRWARTARFDSCLLDLVLDKRLVMRIDNGGGIRFVARAFALGVGGVAGSEHGATERPH